MSNRTVDIVWRSIWVCLCDFYTYLIGTKTCRGKGLKFGPCLYLDLYLLYANRKGSSQFSHLLRLA